MTSARLYHHYLMVALGRNADGTATNDDDGGGGGGGGGGGMEGGDAESEEEVQAFLAEVSRLP